MATYFVFPRNWHFFFFLYNSICFREFPVREQTVLNDSKGSIVFLLLPLSPLIFSVSHQFLFPFSTKTQDIDCDNYACTEQYDPVCDSEGTTHSNLCFFDVAVACRPPEAGLLTIFDVGRPCRCCCILFTFYVCCPWVVRDKLSLFSIR